MPGQRSSTPSLCSVTHSAHDGAWCRPMGGSSGNGPGTASSLSSWRSRMDRRCHSPRCGSTGARTENPWSPSPSSRRQPPRPLADIHHRQPAIIDSNRFDDWLDPTSPGPWLLELVREPRAGPYERRPVSTRVNSVQNDDPDILLAVPEKGLF